MEHQSYVLLCSKMTSFPPSEGVSEIIFGSICSRSLWPSIKPDGLRTACTAQPRPQSGAWRRAPQGDCCLPIMGASLVICINTHFILRGHLKYKKNCMEDKISSFELLLCNYWGAYLQIFIYNAIYSAWCRIVLVQKEHRRKDRA